MEGISIFYSENRPLFYVYTEDIVADVKPDWWSCTFIALVPEPFRFTLLLREEYLYGKEFTMGGIPKVIKPLKDIDIKSAPTQSMKDEKEKPEEDPKPIKRDNIIYPKFGGKRNEHIDGNDSDTNDNDNDIA
jgi:hypothetical protein